MDAEHAVLKCYILRENKNLIMSRNISSFSQTSKEMNYLNDICFGALEQGEATESLAQLFNWNLFPSCAAFFSLCLSSTVSLLLTRGLTHMCVCALACISKSVYVSACVSVCVYICVCEWVFISELEHEMGWSCVPFHHQIL